MTTAMTIYTLEFRDKGGKVLKIEPSPVRGKTPAKLYAKKYLNPAKGLNTLGARSILVIELGLVITHEALKPPDGGWRGAINERTPDLFETMQQHMKLGRSRKW